MLLAEKQTKTHQHVQINSKIVPSYFALLKADELRKRAEHLEKLGANIAALVQAADERVSDHRCREPFWL
jgi:hypothetical protein